MTDRTLPNIDADRLNGFKKMAHAVVDDLVEAATDMASRHDHMVDLLKARVAEQDQDAADVASHMGAMNKALGAALGEEHGTLGGCVYSAIEFIGRAQHRITEVQKQLDKAATEAAPEFFGLTVADLAEVLKEEAGGEDGGGQDDVAVAACLEYDDGDIAVVDTVRNLCSEVRRLRRDLDVATSLTTNLQPKKVRAVAELAAIPMEQGPFVVTMKRTRGRRFMATTGVGDVVWCVDPSFAQQYATRAQAEAAKPRRSAVVTIADARELIEAEKVSSIAPSAAAPGPEAA